MKWIKDNFLNVIIILLVIMLFLGRCEKPSSRTERIRDTVWIYHDSVITTIPTLIKTIPINVETVIKETKYLPDTNYQRLVVQYRNLLSLYLEKNIQRDTLRIKEFGYISVTDTVENNMITGRNYDYKIKYPEISIIENKNQLYIGGILQGSVLYPISTISTGILLKTKKDKIFGANIGINKDGNMMFGVSSYWKIKLR